MSYEHSKTPHWRRWVKAQIDSLVADPGSSLEVEDGGSSLTTAATKLNFVGFVVSEPVDDEITITRGVSGANDAYTPGYASYTRVDDNTFTIDLIDAANLFYVGRRVRFTKAGAATFGTISAVEFDNVSYPDDTLVDLTMEGTDTVPTDPFEVSLVRGNTAWSPIAGDPFSGGSINDICTGAIAGDEYWFAVGNTGKIATSSDAGRNWTLLTTTTTEHFNCCCYDSANDTFWAGGQAGVLAYSTNGTSVTEDTTSIPNLVGSGTDDIDGISYSSSEDSLVVLYQTTATTNASASSIDQGSTWTARETNIGSLSAHIRTLETDPNTVTNGGPARLIMQSDTGIAALSSHDDTTEGSSDSLGAGNIPSAMGFFYDTAKARVYGCENGSIIGVLGWTGDDTTTFSYQINDMAYADDHVRLVCVGNNGIIGYWDASSKTSTNAWNVVTNGFNPTANVNAVAWNTVDGVFCAVANNGQICRSSNGTN